MKNCLIIDDDPLICDLLKHFCNKLSWVDSCLSVNDGNKAIQAISSQTFDLIFLDYNLPDVTGKDLLSIIPVDIPVIMVTTEASFGAASYNFPQIIDFLVKPISNERFLKAILKFQRMTAIGDAKVSKSEKADKIAVKDGTATVILKLADIQYVKSESNYAVFYLENKKVMSLMSLKQLSEDLPLNFVRIHKSYLINTEYLEAVTTDEVQLATINLPIGAKYKEDLLKYIAAI